MNRIRIRLAALSLVVLLPAALAGCFGGGSDPQQTLDETTVQGIQSGVLDASVDISAGSTGDVTASLKGPFQGQLTGQTGSLPQVDWTGSVQGTGLGQSVNGTAELVITSDNIYATYNGATYQLGSAAFKQIQKLQQQAVSQSQSGGSQQSFSEACQQAIQQAGGGDTSACDVDFSSWLSNLSDEGTTDVGGTSTTHLHADVNVGQMLTDLTGIAQAAGGSAGASIDPSQLSQASDAITGASIDIYSGEDDHILRQATISLTVDPSKVAAASASPIPIGPINLKVSVAFSDVNQDQTISAPPNAANAKQIPGLGKLFSNGLSFGLPGAAAGGSSQGFLPGG